MGERSRFYYDTLTGQPLLRKILRRSIELCYRGWLYSRIYMALLYSTVNDIIKSSTIDLY